MRSFKTLTITVAAAVLLFGGPAAHAQSQSDLERMQTFLSIMTNYFQVIESTYAIASDPEKAAILQMSKIQEVYEQRGEKARATDVLREVLEDSNNPTIRNAAYMLLGDNLKESGRSDEALEMLRRGLDENIRAAD